MAEREPLGVIGAGWVGLVTATCFAELGHEIWCRDIVTEKIESLRRGEAPMYEPRLGELLERNRERLHFTTDIGDVVGNAELLFCCVDTPPTYSGDADLSRVNQVVDELGDSADHAIVMKSTVPVGTGRAVTRRRQGIGYVSNPEFLKEGSAVADFMSPDRVVIGSNADAGGFADRVGALYEPLGAEIVRTDIASAEMIKLASNAFLATKISFINEIANVSEELGADVAEVARGMGLDERIGPQFLRAGIGFGGSCLVGEETVLARRYGRTSLVSLERLWQRLSAGYEADDGVIEPDDLEVLSWVPGEDQPRYMSVMAATRRDYDGDIVELRTKMGRRVRCTPDHPWVVGDGDPDGELEIKAAEDLTERDWLPLAQGAADGDERQIAPSTWSTSCTYVVRNVDHVGSATALAAVDSDEVTFRPRRDQLTAFAAMPATERAAALQAPRALGSRTGDIKRAGTMRLDERLRLELGPDDSHLGIPRSGECVTSDVTLDEQRLPDLIWEQSPERKWALLSGLWEGDGSWSLIQGGPSVILEWGTVSRELADGVMRLLGDLGIVASQRIGRTAKSTVDTYWLRVSGAEQVERAIQLVPRADRTGVLASISRQRKRLSPAGYRRREGGPAWVRLVGTERSSSRGPVYSLEVPGSHTFVTTAGITCHNCFPKDVSALKQLAGNTGYHFQLLTAVIEVNELQKRRTIGKLQKHLGSLIGKEIALLGLAFKPNTDDIREATSLVLAARLQGEGANVRVYDPVAADRARELLGGATISASALEALTGADAAVLVTEWPEFGELDWAGEVKGRMKVPLVIDGRNFLDGGALRQAGFTYEGVGR